MIRRRRTMFAAAGLLALALGLILRLLTHGNYSHFASGFLIGISIALLVFGAERRSRRASS